MPRFHVIFSKFYLKCVDLDWSIVILALISHYTLSYFGFQIAGESNLLAEGAFPYYYITTVSTVGYGDLSPSSYAGRFFFVAFVLPGGLTIFTVVLGKAVTHSSDYFKKKAKGMGDYSKLQDATVIIGYNPQRTQKLIAEIKASAPDVSYVILMSVKNVPASEDWRLVKAQSLSNLDDLRRSGIEGANRIIVYADSDDLTLASVLAVRALNKKAHLVCYFADAEKADLIKGVCKAEIVISSSVEHVARELTDPGSNAILKDLVSAQSGISTFSQLVPREGIGQNRQSFSRYIAENFGAILISVKSSAGHHKYDPRDATVFRKGDVVFYISKQRIPETSIRWDE